VSVCLRLNRASLCEVRYLQLVIYDRETHSSMQLVIVDLPMAMLSAPLLVDSSFILAACVSGDAR
jgi:hypothetical protein